ncbi:hypothetical protein ScalyP_jg5200 [Parmales sp. scaly parma]|nr:hypothetical protein ScalyP_jg5200 [Parmales sp. scaly parma]
MNYDIKLSADIRKRTTLKRQKQEASKFQDAKLTTTASNYSSSKTKDNPTNDDNGNDEDLAHLWESSARKFSMIDEIKVTDDLAYDSQCGTGDIFFASRKGHVRRVRQLVERESVSVNKARWSGITALHRAAGEGQLEVVKYLIKRGSEINAKTTLGWHTPLHFATKNGHEEVCKFLIGKGATWKIYNKDRETPQTWARAGGYANMGRQLEHMVNTQNTKHRREKVVEMEQQFEEKKRLAVLKKMEEVEEEKRKDEAEEERRDEYNKSLGLERMKTETEINLVAEQEDSREDDGWAQKPVNLEKVYYNRKGRRSSFIYNRLINDSIIVQPKRFGATAEVKSVYVTQDKVDIAGVTDTLVKTVGSLSRHMRASKQKTTREFRMSHQRENRKSWQVE